MGEYRERDKNNKENEISRRFGINEEGLFSILNSVVVNHKEGQNIVDVIIYLIENKMIPKNYCNYLIVNSLIDIMYDFAVEKGIVDIWN